MVSGFGIALGSSRGVRFRMDKTDPLKVSFAGGSGTEDDPYKISNVDQLQDMNENLSAHYELVNDIDASVTKDWNDGSGFMPVGKDDDNKFTGSLDGQGYEISGLCINRSSTDWVGLFGYLGETASVEDLGLVDANVIGNDWVGGLVGYNDGRVSNSYATGNVSGDWRVGGLVGYNEGEIQDSYATGEVSGNHTVGGLMAENEKSWVENSFWNVNTTGQSSSAAGTGKTTAEMKDIDTFTNESTEGLDIAWDFVRDPNDDDWNKDIWKIDESGQINNGYPYLKDVGVASNKGDSGNDLPGFTMIGLSVGISFVALYRYRKKRK